ncbi:hypothetical protein HanIR_Chr14g0707661 [Helianthus annuus]|nr:hypothetical protein HanIR_Chr14g0707661 [Helianthus annuus]
MTRQCAHLGLFFFSFPFFFLMYNTSIVKLLFSFPFFMYNTINCQDLRVYSLYHQRAYEPSQANGVFGIDYEKPPL